MKMRLYLSRAARLDKNARLWLPAITLLLAACAASAGERSFTPAEDPGMTAATAAENAASAESAATMPVPTTLAALPVLEDLGPAPSWQNETWINVDEPLRLQDLRGKVVLLEFWTFG